MKEKIIVDEIKRITDEFHKSFLDCEDIMRLTGLGRENVRNLMRSKSFPTQVVGRRKIVSVSNFVLWFMENNYAQEN